MHNIKAADLQEVPKNRPILWALDAYYMGNECPLLVLSMPDTWSLSAHLMVSYRPLNGLLQTTLCAFIPNSGCQSFLLFLGKRLRVYTIVDFSFIRTFAPSF